MNTKIPQGYLDLATAEEIPIEIASDYYINKLNKKGVDGPKYALIKGGYAKDEAAANKMLSKLWRTYNRLHYLHPETVQSPYAETTYKTYLDRASNELDKILGKIKLNPASKTQDNEKGRIAIAGDFHFPFANEKAIAMLLEDPADELVIMGDLFDMYAASRYRQTTDKVRVWQELALGKAYLTKLSEKFSKIYMIKGNHDNRPLRRVQETNPEILPLIVHPIDLVASQFNNVEVISTEVPDTAAMTTTDNVILDYLGIVDDCAFGHFENFCGPDAIRKADRWLGEWQHILGTATPRAIFQAHSHRLQLEFTSKGTLLVGTGCMCNPMEYQFDGHGKYVPPTVGYVVIYRNDGITDLNRTQLVNIGVSK